MKKKSASQSAFFNPRVLIGVLFLVALLLGLFASDLFPGASAQAARPAQNPKAGPSHKVSVTDPQLVEQLKVQGARMIGDYGSFVILEISDEAASRLGNNPKAEIVDHNNLVLLNAGTIDTRTSEARAMQSAVSGIQGKQMRLIQFAGPIRGEWYQALVATGARIVTYIPHNAYLVYGTASELENVHALALNSSVGQWDAEYTAAFRLDPAVTKVNAKSGAVPENLSPQGNEQFIIQLVDDPSENAATLGLIEQSKLEPLIKKETVAGYVNVTVALPREIVLHQLASRVDVVSIQEWGTPRLNDEAQDIIISGNLAGNIPVPMDYLTYLTGKGFNVTTTAGFGVNISDDGLDNGTTTPNHFGLYRVGDPTVPANSRVSYVRPFRLEPGPSRVAMATAPLTRTSSWVTSRAAVFSRHSRTPMRTATVTDWAWRLS